MSDPGTGQAAPGTPTDPLATRATRRRCLIWGGSLGAVLLISVTFAVGLGPVPISPNTGMAIFGHELFGHPAEVTWPAAEQSIVWTVRAPRVLLGAAVGAGLAVCGAVLQAMVRNFLADPYVLGVSGGASTGAAAAILFGAGAGLGQQALPISAFLGSLGASLLVFFVARSGGQVTSLRLLLAGVAVGYALSAATSFLIFASGSAEGARSVMFWLLGSLTLGRWDVTLLAVVVIVALCTGLFTLWGRRLDALAIGDETALTLGVRPERKRIKLLVLASLCVGVVVATSGSIGFVGLVIPHLARRIVGAAHGRMLPVAALLGAVFLIWADVLARTMMQPQELPLGILTAIVGAPFLLILVRRMYGRQR